MALPGKEQGVIDMIAEEEAQQKRDAAVAAVSGSDKAEDAEIIEETKVQPAQAEQASAQADDTAKPSNGLAVADQAKAVAATVQTGGNAMAFLAEQGIDDIKIDFTSFPTVTLNRGKFSTSENKNFGDRLECVYMDKRTTHLMRGENVDRDKEALLAYSDDGLTENGSGKPLAEIRAEWEKNPEISNIDMKPYVMVIVNAIDGPHAGEIIQLQVSPASQGKLGGYLYALGIRKVNPREVVTVVSVGPEVGSGTKAFNPWVFKELPKK